VLDIEVVISYLRFKLQNNAMNRFRYFVENQIFGVCTRMGEVLNFSASSIRLYFIYATFLTFGSPIIIYLVMAFWVELGKHLRRHKNPTIWE